MLQKIGWKKGEGLGKQGAGITVVCVCKLSVRYKLVCRACGSSRLVEFEHLRIPRFNPVYVLLLCISGPVPVEMTNILTPTKT